MGYDTRATPAVRPRRDLETSLVMGGKGGADGVIRFRQSGAFPIAGFLALIGSAAFAAQRWWLAPIMLIPLAVVVYGLRSGVDATKTELRVRSAVRTRRLGWSDITGFSTDGRHLHAHLVEGKTIKLPAVRSVDLPRLLAAGGQELAEKAADEKS